MSEATPYELSRLSPTVKHEVLKLWLIVKASRAPIYPSYLLEKLERIRRGVPIALDPGKQAEYNRIVGEEG